jgi:hypothetical protein
MRISHVEARSSRAAAQQFVAESHDHKPSPRWDEQKYPGSAVRQVLLIKDDVLGSVDIRPHAPSSIKVCCFLPGIEECSPGDTPKTWPERHRWCSDKDTADRVFDAYLMQLMKEGWKEYDRERQGPVSAEPR